MRNVCIAKMFVFKSLIAICDSSLTKSYKIFPQEVIKKIYLKIPKSLHVKSEIISLILKGNL